jgi:hypothetical protein
MTALLVSMAAGILGFLLGFWFIARQLERQCEIAYLVGHVDGYTKAVADSGEVPL